MASFKEIDDVYWGNDEITGDEFDLLQSQAIGITQAEQINPGTSTTEVEHLREQQYVQDGQIRMLRESLLLRSKELDQERLERERILETRLQDQRDKEIQLQRNSDRLISQLKFKDQELRSANNKLHALEQKLKQSNMPLHNGSLSTKKNSPEKVANSDMFSFSNKPAVVSKDTQTDGGKANSFQRNAGLTDVSHVPGVSYSLPHIDTERLKVSDVRFPCSVSRLTNQRNFPKPVQFSDARFQNNIRQTICLTNKGISTTNLHLSCYCTIESQSEFWYPEVGMLQQIRDYVDEYTTVMCKLYGIKDMNGLCSEVACHCPLCNHAVCSHLTSNSESIPKEVLYHIHTLMITAMDELVKLLSVSKVTGKVLLENCKFSSSLEAGVSEQDKLLDESDPGHKSLLMYLVSTAIPLFSFGELLNEAIIEWILTVLHTLAIYGCPCCLKCFDSVIRHLCLNCMLDGTCGVEIAFLALDLLCWCVPCTFMEAFIGHHSEPCVLKSIAQFYSESLKNFSESQMDFFLPLVLNFLTRLITYHGANILSDYSCNCFSELLQAIIPSLLQVSKKCSSASNLILRRGLHFLHLVFKSLGRFRELRGRVEDEYVMLICDSSTKCKVVTELKDLLEIVHDLWDFRQDEGKEFDKDEVKAMEITETE